MRGIGHGFNLKYSYVQCLYYGICDDAVDSVKERRSRREFAMLFQIENVSYLCFFLVNVITHLLTILSYC